MAEPQRTFTFLSDALTPDTLRVTKLNGTERISQPFHFDLELVASRPDLDFATILSRPARISVQRRISLPGSNLFAVRQRKIHGRVVRFEIVEKRAETYIYHAVLVPRLWKLSLSYRSRVFQNMTVQQIVQDILQAAGFTEEEFQFRLGTTRPYESREYVVQYEESDLDFISRWLEHEGIYYYFDMSGSADKVVFGDGTDAYGSLQAISPVRFRQNPEGQTWAASEDEAIRGISLRQELIPKTLMLKDYNWKTPSADLLVTETVSAKGEGEVYEYNNHYKTKDEGQALAKVRAQEILSRERVFTGEGNATGFTAGSTWKLSEHFREDHNVSHLLTEVTHSAEQTAVPQGDGQVGVTYRNSFKSIPADRNFRPARLTAWPSVKGVMHAKIDASGTGLAAELDEHGRYKVRLPLDLSNPGDGKASRWVRQSTPYSGSDHGMQFPLHKGTEVILTHVDGDPDRPVIAGSVPNPDNPSPVVDGNSTMSGFKTAGGNTLRMDDTEGHQRMVMKAGPGTSRILLGSGSTERFEASSVTAEVLGHLTMNLGSYYSTEGFSGKSFGIHAGFLPAVILMETLEIAKNLTKEYWLDKKKEDWGVPVSITANLFLTAVNVVANILIKKYLVKAPIEELLSRYGEVAKLVFKGWSFAGVAKYVADALMSIVADTGTARFGVKIGYVENGATGNGAFVKLENEPDGILIATNTMFATVHIGGPKIHMLADHSIALHCDDEIFLDSKKGGFLLMNDDGILMHHTGPPSAIRMGDRGLTHQSETINLFAELADITSPLMSIGKKTFMTLEGMDGRIALSATTRIIQRVGTTYASVEKDQVLLNASAGPQGSTILCGSTEVKINSSGDVTIATGPGKKITIGTAATDVFIKAKNVDIDAMASVSIASKAPSKFNNSMFNP